MVCECEYALCHSHQNLCCSLQWTLDQVEIHPNLTSHCPSGPFPASRYISTCILLYLYNDRWTYNHIMLWCSKEPSHWGKLSEQRRHLKIGPLLLDASATTYLWYISTRIQYTGSEPWIIICAVWSSVHKAIFLMILSWLKKRVIVLSKVLLY